MNATVKQFLVVSAAILMNGQTLAREATECPDESAHQPGTDSCERHPINTDTINVQREAS